MIIKLRIKIAEFFFIVFQNSFNLHDLLGTPLGFYTRKILCLDTFWPHDPELHLHESTVGPYFGSLNNELRTWLSN